MSGQQDKRATKATETIRKERFVIVIFKTRGRNGHMSLKITTRKEVERNKKKLEKRGSFEQVIRLAIPSRVDREVGRSQ